MSKLCEELLPWQRAFLAGLMPKVALDAIAENMRNPFLPILGPEQWADVIHDYVHEDDIN